MFSNSFAGIAPASVPLFVGAEVLGGALALGVVKLLYPSLPSSAAWLGQPKAASSVPTAGRPSTVPG